MSILLEGEGDAATTEAHRYQVSGDAGDEEQRRMGMTQVVKPDGRYVSPDFDLEVFGDPWAVAYLDRNAFPADRRRHRSCPR